MRGEARDRFADLALGQQQEGHLPLLTLDLLLAHRRSCLPPALRPPPPLLLCLVCQQGGDQVTPIIIRRRSESAGQLCSAAPILATSLCLPQQSSRQDQEPLQPSLHLLLISGPQDGCYDSID